MYRGLEWDPDLVDCVCVSERVGFWLDTSINGKGIRERLSPLSSPHRPVGETRCRLDLGMRRDAERAAYLILSKKSPPTSRTHKLTQKTDVHKQAD